MTARLRDHVGLLCLAVGAVSLIVVRACLQSITIDEANTCLDWACNTWPSHWFPNSGNHVLNSALARLSVSIFGINEVTLRLPAILGATVYVGSAAAMAVLLTSRKLLQIMLFLCLFLNPLILDYLIAARGYSLAAGFLLAALTVMASAMLSGAGNAESLKSKCVWISFFLALSFASNFSFAYVDAVAALLFFWWTVRAPERKIGLMRLAVCCFLPGILTAIALCGPTAWDFPKAQLYFGSQSLSEMLDSFVSGSFDDPNPYVANRWLLLWVEKARPVLPVLGALSLFALLMSMEARRWLARKPGPDPRFSFARLLVAVAGLALVLHWMAWRAAHIPLPKNRTGLFFVLLWTVIFGAALAARYQSPARDWLRSLGILVLTAAAVYFASCLRIGHFSEWKFDADTKQIYWAVDEARRRCASATFGIDWRYTSALNFYRLAYRNAALPNFATEESGALPQDRAVYAVFYPTSQDLIREQHLQVLYHNAETGAAVAVRGCQAGRP